MNTPKKYRKKPVVIEAIRFTKENIPAVWKFIDPDKERKNGVHDLRPEAPPVAVMETLEGKMEGHVGDWIVKGISGEFYPCKDDIFQKTYEEAE